MKLRIYALILTACMALCSVCSAGGVTSFERLLLPSYWTDNNPKGDTLVMDQKMIKELNASIRGMSRTVVHMPTFPATYSGDALKTKIMDYQILEDELYTNGAKVSDNFKSLLRKQTNVAAIPATVNVRYGVVVRRSNVRNLPTNQQMFFYAGDTEFDALQETVLDPGEPVAILHTSANGFFYYVQAYNYSGWVSKLDIAVVDRNTYMRYANPSNFLVVTNKLLEVKVDNEKILYQQGARLPLLSSNGTIYVVAVPVRNFSNGSLIERHVNLVKSVVSKNINEGYLKYTSNNIIRTAFKNYASTYGWGGLKNSVDCSSMINNIYRTVGIILPRNADEQALSAGKHNNFDGMDDANRIAHIRNMMPGAALHLDGHCMMYLGTSNDVPYVIHSMGSHFVNGQRQRVMQVVVSDLSLCRSSGNTFLSELITGIEYK